MKPEVRKRGSIPASDLRVLTIDREARSAETFGHLRLDGLVVIESSLRQCVFDDVRVRSTCFGGGVRQSVFEDCVFRRSQLTFGPVGNARLVRCRFESCRLENVIGTQLELIECSFPDTTIKRGVFHGTNAERGANQFYGNDFSRSGLANVDFRGGIDLAKQTLPTGEDYLFIRDTCHASQIVRALGQQHDALAKLLEFYCSDGQRTQLLCVAEWGLFDPEIRSRLVLGRSEAC